MKRILVLFLVLCLLLSGCALLELAQLSTEPTQPPQSSRGTHFDDMVYTRPDMTAFSQTLQTACDAAAAGESVEAIMDAVYDFYDAYDSFYTNYALADIHYSMDLTDSYWEAEYDFCSQTSSQADAALDELYYALADSPLRARLEKDRYFDAGFLDAYEGESMWDNDFLALMEQESSLVSQYYTLSQNQLEALDDDAYYAVGEEMEQLYVELVKTRRQIADYVGYDSYVDFAYDYYYTRDYTPAQVEPYLADIQKELVPLYRQTNTWGAGDAFCGEQETFDYVKSTATAMGGKIADCFEIMSSKGLYDLTPGANKYNSSFEIYLYTYSLPFVFVNPSQNQWDKLSFGHEFGHFANDYLCRGSVATVDVAEIFSQGYEYLSLCYGEDTDTLTQMKMVDCLCIYVEQSAYAAFEHQVYDLPADQITQEGIRNLFSQVCTDYGFDSWGFDSRDYVSITHFFTNPLYTISYVISNDAAFQLYQMECSDPGTGLSLYESQLRSGETGFLSFVDAAGLTNPFEPGRAASIRQTLEDIL